MTPAIAGARPARSCPPSNQNDPQKTWHPASEIFPILEGRPFDELAADIREHGLREPIVLDAEGRILDGRNRARACAAAGIEPRYVTWKGEGSPVAFVVSLNLHRRHLDDAQRALIASKLATLEKGTRQDRSRDPSTPTQAESARLMHVSESSVKRARQVLKSGVPELVEAVERGALPLKTAAHVATLDPEAQRATVTKGRGPAKTQPPTVDPRTDDEAITARLLELFGDGDCYRLQTIAAGLKLPVTTIRARLDDLITSSRSVLADRIGRGKDTTYRLVRGDHRTVDAGIVLQELNRLVEHVKAPAIADQAIAKIATGLRAVIERMATRAVPGAAAAGPTTTRKSAARESAA
jgi:ParB-like chromosome segregation protein Spo0J